MYVTTKLEVSDTSDWLWPKCGQIYMLMTIRNCRSFHVHASSSFFSPFIPYLKSADIGYLIRKQDVTEQRKM